MDSTFGAHRRFMSFDGLRLHWVELGEPNANPPLVLMHGLNDSHRTWRQVAPELARHRRVLVPDLPGHGLSARPDATYELRWYARTMARWLDELGLDSLDVVGHSFGGGVGMVFLLECPERLRRLALVSSGGLGREIGLPLRLASIPYFVEHFGQPFMGPCTMLALKVTRVVPRDEIERLSAMNAQRGSARAFARTVRDIVDWRGQRHSFFQRAHELSRLPSIAVFWGDRDPIIPVHHARALTNYVHGIRVTVFEGCGHYPHHERPAALVGALSDFLDDPAVPQATLRRRPLHVHRSSAGSTLSAHDLDDTHVRRSEDGRRDWLVPGGHRPRARSPFRQGTRRTH